VAGIAKRYRVSPQQVAQWNRVSASATFQRGQAVVVYVPTGKANARRVVAVRSNAVSAKSRAPARVVASAARSNARNSAIKAARPSVNRNARVRVASAR